MIKVVSHTLKLKEHTKNSNTSYIYYDRVVEVENIILLNNVFFLSPVQRKVKMLTDLESKNIQFTNELKKKLIHLHPKTHNGISSYEYYCFSINNLELEFFEESKAIEEYNKMVKKIELKHNKNGL